MSSSKNTVLLLVNFVRVLCSSFLSLLVIDFLGTIS